MRSLLAVVVAALLLLTGCTVASSGTRKGAEALRDDLGTPDWTTGITVGTGRDGQFEDFVQTTVNLGDAATADQVVAFTLAFPAAVAKAGLDDGYGLRRLRFVQPGGSSLDMVPSTALDEVAVTAGVVRWQGVAELALDSAQLDLGNGMLTHTVTAPTPEAVGSTYAAVRADPALSLPTDSWNVIYAREGIDIELRADTLPTDADLDLWEALVAAAATLPAELPRTGLRLALLERTLVDLTVATPDDLTEAALTPEAYGELLWPAFRGQLAALHDTNRPWTYTSQFAPVSTPTLTTILVSLLDDQPPVDNGDVSTRWSRAARDYVDALG